MPMMRWIRLAPALGPVAALLFACTAPPRDRDAAAEAFSPYGAWTIVAVNGAPAVRVSEAQPAPNVTFTSTTYGGATGCNAFGGIGVWSEGRWHGDWPVANQMGCPTVQEQERLIFAILAAGPRIETHGQDGVRAVASTGTLDLRRASTPTARQPSTPTRAMAGSTWRISGVDGAPRSRDDQRLSIEGGRWSYQDLCARFGGAWSQQGQAVRLTFDPPQRDCSTGSLRPLFEALAASDARVSTGPNGEFVLAGGGRWLSGVALPPNGT
jgi:heat shock protein HslJ